MAPYTVENLPCPPEVTISFIRGYNFVHKNLAVKGSWTKGHVDVSTQPTNFMVDDNGCVYIKFGYIMQEVVLPTHSIKEGAIDFNYYQHHHMIHVGGYIFGQFIKNFVVTVLAIDDKQNKKTINTLLDYGIDINL